MSLVLKQTIHALVVSKGFEETLEILVRLIPLKRGWKTREEFFSGIIWEQPG